MISMHLAVQWEFDMKHLEIEKEEKYNYEMNETIYGPTENTSYQDTVSDVATHMQST